MFPFPPVSRLAPCCRAQTDHIQPGLLISLGPEAKRIPSSHPEWKDHLVQMLVKYVPLIIKVLVLYNFLRSRWRFEGPRSGQRRGASLSKKSSRTLKVKSESYSNPILSHSCLALSMLNVTLKLSIAFVWTMSLKTGHEG